MNAKIVVLGIVCLAFLGQTAGVLMEYGAVGWIPPLNESSLTRLLTVDLLLNIIIVLGFIRKDAQKWGISFTPFLLLTLATGAAGPVAYLIRREFAKTAAPNSLANA